MKTFEMELKIQLTQKNLDTIKEILYRNEYNVDGLDDYDLFFIYKRWIQEYIDKDSDYMEETLIEDINECPILNHYVSCKGLFN